MKTKFLYIFTLAILSVGVYFFVSHQRPTTQKCPDDYANDDAGSAEYLTATDKWTNDFYDSYPGATLSDWSAARIQFWKDNNCTAVLQRYKEGKADPVTIDNPKYVSELGFSFNYPNDMYVMKDPDVPRLFIISNSYKTNMDQPVTGIVITATPNEPPMTPLEWLNGPDSGADMSKGYSKLNIDGQKAISMNGDIWVVVNTPDNKRQMSIATLPSVNPSQSLVAVMSSIVSSIVFTK